MHIKETFPELYQIRRPLKTAEARAALSGKSGRELWRSLEELAATPEFEETLHREFPQQAVGWGEGTDRRTFLKLMGASLALAGLSGCSYQPPEAIVPYVSQPEEIIPGKPLFFATAMPFAGGATPLLARSNMGRPTKLDGNNLHPASGGAADVFAQAAILSLYDPDRSETIINRGEVRTYTAFLAEMATLLEGQREKQGAGLRILTETVTSPTLAAQLRDILRRFPGARWHQWEPGGAGTAAAATALAFGTPATPLYRFDQADRVLALDANFLECGPGALRYARDFATRRRVRDGETREPARLYAVETTPTNTGVFADHRLPVRPSELEAVARAIAGGLGVGSGAQLTGELGRFVSAVVEDLRAHPGRSIVVAGDEQSPQLHALAHAMNAALGNQGRTVVYLDPVEENPVDQVEDLRRLIADIDAGVVEILVIVGGNPVYNTPADLSLRERMLKVPVTVHLSLYNDETSELCQWHIPEAHFLESWGDARAFDGTVCLLQPLIRPLYNGKSAYEFLAAFTEQPERTGYQLIREYWMTPGAGQAATTPAGPQPSAPGGPPPPQPAATPTPAATPAPTPAAPRAAVAPSPQPSPGPDFEQRWRRWVHDGFIPDTARRERSVAVGAGFGAALGPAPVPPGGGPDRPFEIVFRTDPCVYDGRFANNGWLQELPKPLTKLTWDNAAIISPQTAVRLGVGVAPDGALKDPHPPRVNRYTAKGGEARVEVVRLRFRGREVTAPVWIFPGQPDDVVTVHLGYGRWRGGQIAGGRENTFENPGTVGFNAYKLRTSDALWSGQGLEVALTSEQYALASTQIHFQLEGRAGEILHAGTYEQWRRDPRLVHAGEHAAPETGGEEVTPHETMSLYPEYDYAEGDYNSRGYKWGMMIDVSTCVGCNACVVACQAENNIPVVGKEQVARSREMHWLRVDAYFRGSVSAPGGVYFMPVPCMHCEKAPCEPVCPVHATVHSAEGLNDMVYNRCVGTRYCSNNCPYKVRRFNFFLYADWDTPSLKMLRNPEVTVRSRGVMEKCTYCVQRISHARIEAEKEGRKVRDGEVQTACQATCPTEAIIFGDLNDPQSRVARLSAQKHAYGVLDDLNTQPRTRYLASVRNPNPALEGEA